MKPIYVQSKMLAFDASSLVNRNGVMNVSKKFVSQIEAFCKNHGLEISSVGGNNDQGEYYVLLKEELTEEQAEELMG